MALVRPVPRPMIVIFPRRLFFYYETTFIYPIIYPSKKPKNKLIAVPHPHLRFPLACLFLLHRLCLYTNSIKRVFQFTTGAMVNFCQLPALYTDIYIYTWRGVLTITASRYILCSIPNWTASCGIRVLRAVRHSFMGFVECRKLYQM